MNYQTLLGLLTEKTIISAEQATQINTTEKSQPFSIHWELRSILLLGITFLSTGLGILIYKNIDTIGHNILIGLIAIVCMGCFYYAFMHKKPFSWQEVLGTTNLDDFALLGGCLTFLTLESYLQYQYTIFGTRYGLAAFIPAVLFFFCAYRFDHRGVLSMAITALASGVGVSIAPVQLWEANDFNSLNLIITALLLGSLVIFTGWISEQRDLKKHFSFTYFLLGGNLAFVAALAGLFEFDWKIIYFIAAAVLSYLYITYARQKHSYIFLLMGVVYGYIAVTYGIFKLMPNDLDAFFFMLYFMLTGAGVILFLIKIKEIIGLKK
ncbi:DUF2157 domain-containing protein [Emticicia sp.]|uniref:DUF2157 domain-containing protein n=1 Tax=Emticicia sp. TaxID=1930953 RepID=UPI0037503BF6